MPIRYLKCGIPLNAFVTITLAAFCFFNAINLHAAEYQYLIEATALAEHIENPQRNNFSNDEDELEELLSQQRLRGTLSRATSKLVTSIDYQGTKNNYRKNLLVDRTYLTGASSIEWIVVPERLSWDVTNTRTLQIVDSLLPDTLDNRQVISLTSTGPRVTFPLSGRNKLSGSVNYSIADYEKSSLSRQDRTTAELLFSHNFSSRYISSIGGNFLQSEFDDTPALDFDRYEYFWQNEYVTEVFDLNLMLGQNAILRDNFEDLENFLIRFTGDYKVNSQSTVQLNYSDSYEDIFSNMLSTPSSSGQLIGDRLGNSNLTQNYQLVQKGISYLYTKSEFFNMNVGYSESERKYDRLEIAENQFDKVFNVGANWKFFENLDFSLYGRYTEQEFSGIDRQQDRNEYGLRAAYRISKSLYTQFAASNIEQNGSYGLDNYDGFNASLSLTFVLGN